MGDVRFDLQEQRDEISEERANAIMISFALGRAVEAILSTGENFSKANLLAQLEVERARGSLIRDGVLQAAMDMVLAS